MKLVHKLVAKVLRKNLAYTPPEVISDQMREPRPLPMGRKEFDEWANRCIAGALLPHGEFNQKDDYEAFVDGQKFALANMLMHIGPTESHKPDAHFIHALRVAAIKQAAHTIGQEYHLSAKARLAAKEAREKELAESDELPAALNKAEQPTIN